MIKNTNAARPYAKAIFALAEKKAKLAEWMELLKFLAAVVGTKKLVALWLNPTLSSAKKINFLASVCKDAGFKITVSETNLLKLLATKHQLILLPEITNLYLRAYAAHTKFLTAEVTSALELSQVERDKLCAALEKRFKHQIKLDLKIDPELIGGAIIRVDDYVIDGSVRGQIQKLKGFVKHLY